MLSPYKPINHQIKQMQIFVGHLVIDVWCNPSGNFSLYKLHVDFQQIAKSSKTNLLGPIKVIYGDFKKLNSAQLAHIKKGFLKNNQIEKLCKGETKPLLYDYIQKINPILVTRLKAFFHYLYSGSTALSKFSKTHGNMDGYYKEFLKYNDTTCPFCGITRLLDEEMNVRDAFDHFLPQKHYPFISVEVTNLVPACKYCNELFKNAKNTLKDGAKWKKAFFPFATKLPNINIAMTLKKADLTDLKHADIDITFRSKTHQEEIDTWLRLYGLEKRYKNELKGGEAKSWLEMFKIILPAKAVTKSKMEKRIIENFIVYKMNDLNFLRLPFYNACKKRGLL